MLIELFLVGTGLWFWLLITAVVILELFCVENESPVLAGFFIAATVAVLYFFGNLDLRGAVEYMIHNPLNILGYIGGYFVIGAFWSLVKWVFYTTNKRHHYNEVKREWLEDHGIKGTLTIPANLLDEWKEYAADHHYIRDVQDRLLPSHNKSRISVWIVYWPFSALWTLINDPVRRIVRQIRQILTSFYEGISKWSMRGTEDELSGLDEVLEKKHKAQQEAQEKRSRGY
jgi:hypothetical protein